MPSQNDNQNKKLLLFTIGPVQEFIAAARSTRDLWSGSYLLSTLSAAALRETNNLGGEIVFPYTKNQPLVNGKPKSSENADRIAFLTPTLPNRFLALISSDCNPEAIAEAATNKLAEIAKKVSDFISESGKSEKNGYTFDRDRFQFQAARLLEIQWQTLPIEEPNEILRRARTLPKNDKWDPCKHIGDNSQIDHLWGPLNATINWLLDGRKALRNFDAWSGGDWQSGMNFLKDQLNGKDEAVFTVSNNLSDPALENLASDIFKLNKQGGLKKGEALGAATLIKRFWGNAYLTQIDHLPRDPDGLRRIHGMGNTHAIAQYDPTNEDSSEPSSELEKYFAILAMDGDEMGKWISGQKFKRALNQADHTEFSKILNEFSVEKAAEIVEKHHGKLIYSGGDDVLAMLPAGTALGCAKALRDQFIECFEKENPGKYAGMDASVGIAIAHFKSPLQDVVKEAQTAEKRAKRATKDNGLGRGAVAFTIMKRSGEILKWGTKWKQSEEDSPGITLIENLQKDLKSKKLNARFPHKLEAQLTPYLPQSTSIKSDDVFAQEFNTILEKEIQHTLSRNAGGALGVTQLADFTAYWNSSKEKTDEKINESSQKEAEATKNPQENFSHRLALLINLLRTAAWMARSAKDEPSGNETPESENN